MSNALAELDVEISKTTPEQASRLASELSSRVSTLLVRLRTPAQSQEPDKLIGVQAAAVLLSMHYMTLYRKAHEFPFVVRVGKRIRFSERGIQKWIAAKQGR